MSRSISGKTTQRRCHKRVEGEVGREWGTENERQRKFHTEQRQGGTELKSRRRRTPVDSSDLSREMRRVRVGGKESSKKARGLEAHGVSMSSQRKNDASDDPLKRKRKRLRKPAGKNITNRKGSQKIGGKATFLSSTGEIINVGNKGEKSSGRD